jgi:hypothetical protein
MRMMLFGTCEFQAADREWRTYSLFSVEVFPKMDLNMFWREVSFSVFA